jgi:rubrerythrin
MKQPEPIPAELLEASEDLHTDTMRATTANLDDLVEQGHDRGAGAIDLDEQAAFQERRRRSLHRNLAGAGAFAGLGVLPGLLSWLSSSKVSASMDVQAAQTAAALENLAIAVYGKAAALPFMAKVPDPAGATVTAFVKSTVKQHTDHAGAFNAAVKKLGGKEQTGIDQVVMDKVVTPALPTLTDPLKVVKFAADLELVAAETYAAETAAVSDANLRKVFSSIMGVENQHRAVLLAVGALLENDLAGQVKIPPDLAKLPAAAGSVGFPDAFLPLDQARPAAEGAVK